MEGAVVRVKICGITNRRDAFAAVDAGADAVGFILHPPSPRSVSARGAREIVRCLPAFVVPVGVVVDRSPDDVSRLAFECGFRMIQMHGCEPPAAVRRVRVPVIKALRVRSRSDITAARRYRPAMFLLDSYDPKLAGGTGRSLPFAITRGVRMAAPFFLAGGLNPRTVRAAIRAAKPFGVDASSGVEKSPGRKDRALVRRFVRIAKSC